MLSTHRLATTIVRWVDDEPQPGLVEVQFDDRFGRRWSIIDKTAIVSSELLLRTSGYPQPLLFECVILDRRLDDLGREFVEISIEEPNNTQATDGTTRFEVFADQIVPDDD